MRNRAWLYGAALLICAAFLVGSRVRNQADWWFQAHKELAALPITVPSNKCAGGRIDWPKAKEREGVAWVTVGTYDVITWANDIRLDNIDPYKGSRESAQVYKVWAGADAAYISALNIDDPGLGWVEAGSCLWEVELGIVAPITRYWYAPPGVSEYASTMTITVTNAVKKRTATFTAPNDRPARKPEDRTAEDGWFIGDDTKVKLELTNCYTAAGDTETTVIEERPDAWSTDDPLSLSFVFYGCLRDGFAETTYLRQTITCSAYDTSVDGYEEEFFAGKAKAWGEGNTVYYKMLQDYESVPGSWGCTDPQTIYAPYLVDTSNWHCYSDIDEDNPGVETTCWGMTATEAEWRAASPIVAHNTSWGGWKHNCPGTGTFVWGAVQRRINALYAAENNELDGDRFIVVDVGGADEEGGGSPYRDALTVRHKETLDILDPVSPRPSQFVGSEGVTVS